MTGQQLRTAGFTIIELSLVLIVLGILAVALMPMVQSIHDDAMREQDLAALESAKNALLGYIRVNEGAPCVDVSGNHASSGCDAAQTLDLLGVRTNDSRRMNFVYDVNDTLTLSEIAATGNSLCSALAEIIDPTFPPATAPEPAVCGSANTNTGNTACATSNSMAFVLVGRGSDRCLNLENTHDTGANDPLCPTAVSANRTFENPARIHSRTQDDGYYEDLVLTVTPTELVEIMDCPIGGGGGGGSFYCNSGEKFVNVVNGGNNVTLDIGGSGNCYDIWSGNTSGAGCQPETEILSVRTSGSCSGTAEIGPATLATLDSNTDGRVDVLCSKSGDCTVR